MGEMGRVVSIGEREGRVVSVEEWKGGGVNGGMERKRSRWWNAKEEVSVEEWKGGSVESRSCQWKEGGVNGGMGNKSGVRVE